MNIKQLLKYTERLKINIMQIDFNAEMGSGEMVKGIICHLGLGERNNRGDRLIQFFLEQQFKLTNTWFTLPPRRLYIRGTPIRIQKET